MIGRFFFEKKISSQKNKFFFSKKNFFFLVLVGHSKKSCFFVDTTSICRVSFETVDFGDRQILVVIGRFEGDREILPAPGFAGAPAGRRTMRSERSERSTFEGGCQLPALPPGGRRPPRVCSIACSILCAPSLAFSVLEALAERCTLEGWTDGRVGFLKKIWKKNFISKKKNFFFSKFFFF